MKRHLIVYLIVVLAVAFGFLGADTFETLQNVIKDAVPDGFTMNKGQTWNNRFAYKITYDKDSSGLNRMIFDLFPGKDAFSQMNLAFDHKRFTYQGREALFQDGTKTGMSAVIVILKNKAGRFSVTHRAIGGKAMTMDELEKLLSKVVLEKLE